MEHDERQGEVSTKKGENGRVRRGLALGGEAR